MEILQMKSSALMSIQYTALIKKQLKQLPEYYWEFSEDHNYFNYFKCPDSATFSVLNSIVPFEEHSPAPSQGQGSRISLIANCRHF